MQAALDLAVLMLSRELSQGTSSTSQIGSKATPISRRTTTSTSLDSWDTTNHRKSWYPYNT